MFSGAVEFIIAAASAVVFGTFAEYFIHRSMHWGILHPEGHRHHHEANDARTFMRDFFDYGTGAAALGWLGFLVSTTSGIGWAFGALVYAILASYAHQIQHANADLVFWMKRPVHRLHHNLDMRDHNFGVLVDWWDRLFGSYEPIEYPRETRRATARDYFAIPWR